MILANFHFFLPSFHLIYEYMKHRHWSVTLRYPNLF